MHTMMPLRAYRRGFTLLEVLVAIAILGLGLTVILGSQTGLFSNAKRAEHLTIAIGLLRCKMNEVEAQLLITGYQLTDEHDEGPCCADQSGGDAFHCKWKSERITLPELPRSDPDGGTHGPAGDGGLDLGAIGTLTNLNKDGGAALGENANPSDLAKALGGAPSPASLAPTLISLVYPSLKPMLEASIRKLTVTIQYKEGKAERELTVAQYVTNPEQGQLEPNAPDGGLLGDVGALLRGAAVNAQPGAAPSVEGAR